ncbi:MAG: hypothetical protein HYX34_15920 [Actinobacteria bacterium]|nr:hypothetical protein [Actinomycetota bacterium]
MNLVDVGLRPGERVRYRRRPGQRWAEGTVVGLERDGSLAIRDTAKGAARSIPIDRVEVRAVGPRGARVWEPVSDRVGRTEQLGLF